MGYIQGDGWNTFVKYEFFGIQSDGRAYDVSPQWKLDLFRQRYTYLSPLESAREARRQVTQEKASLEAAERAKAEQVRRKAERQEYIYDQQTRLLANLSLGDETHCGMVIQLRDELAEVQTIAGSRWFRQRDLFAVDRVECRFFNGQYVAPDI